MSVNFDFFSIEPTTIIGVLINTFILLLLFKKFLFEPVNKIIEQRKAEVSKTYVEADETLENARRLQTEYEGKLSEAREESAGIIRAAAERANRRSEEITGNAQREAEEMLRRANVQIEKERARAVGEVKGELSGLALELAEKIVGKQIEMTGEQNRLIDDFIDNI